MGNAVGRLAMKIMTVAVTIPVGMATKAVVVRVWSMARPADAPRNPGEDGVKWGDAVGWASLSAAGIVVTNLVARKGAEELWRTMLGGDPPPRKLSRAEKKQVKQQLGTSQAPEESRPA
ncbi:MAG: DUF4235 domain-containing protein [Actinomycetota bacterium]|nr:DUF4235 domain-containing protein [Actinomycetota bacterium]